MTTIKRILVLIAAAGLSFAVLPQPAMAAKDSPMKKNNHIFGVSARGRPHGRPDPSRAPRRSRRTWWLGRRPRGTIPRSGPETQHLISARS